MANEINMQEVIGTHDVLLITLDTLRFDVAVRALESGQTPFLAELLPGGQWEKRHTPASFTYAAHQAFFAGFLPTPASPGPHPRLMAAQFPGSETTSEFTFVFDAPDIVSGLSQVGYHTICIGGVGFFNQRSPLGSVMPALFHESHWEWKFGVTDPDSTQHQVKCAVDSLSNRPASQRVFLFLNVSAMHQPNCVFLEGATEDSPRSQAAALSYVDRHLPPLFQAMQKRGPVLCVLCSDHGTAYGDDGYHGHRLAHPCVWDVPYAEFLLPGIPT